MSSQQSAGATGRAALGRLQELTTKVDQQATRIASLEATSAAQGAMLDGNTERIRGLEAARDEAQQAARLAASRIDTQQKRVTYLESLLKIGYDVGGVRPPLGVLADNEANTGEDPGEDDDDNDAMLNNSVLRTVVNQTLLDLYGAPHFRDYIYLAYPSVPSDHEDWPSTKGQNGERVPYMRFDFRERYSAPANWKRMTSWVDYIVNHGSTTTPGAKEILPQLSRDQITKACKRRFKYLRGEYRKKSGTTSQATEAPHPPDHASAAPDDQIDPALRGLGIPAQPDIPPLTSLADLRSRAKGKCKIRSTKRDSVDSKYQDAKYDDYFTPGAMSDDEDLYKKVNNVWVKSKGLFNSREWAFASQELRDIRDAIDAVEDKNERSRPTARTRGDPKLGEPRKWEKPHWAMRKWMIDPTALQNNPSWLESGLVLGNGLAWGENEGFLMPKSKKRKTRKESTQKRTANPVLIESAREARRTLQEAERREREVENSETIDEEMQMD